MIDKIILLFRHGQVANFEKKVYNGSYDVGVTAAAAKQFLKIGRFVSEYAKPDIIFSSDLIRAKVGAYWIARFCNAPVETCKGLRERSMGFFENRTWREITDKWPDRAKRFIADPINFKAHNGESINEQKDRVIKSFQSILNMNKKKIVIVAHGGTNRIILSYVKGIPLSDSIHLNQDYGCLNLIFYKDHKFELKEENNTTIYEQYGKLRP